MSTDEEAISLPSEVFSSIGRKLYLKSKKADVHFVFDSNGSCERIPAHKILLASGSEGNPLEVLSLPQSPYSIQFVLIFSLHFVSFEVFDAMFYGSLKEQGDIKIVDASPEAFKQFLRLFYVNHIALTMETVAEVMYLSKKYDVLECLEICSVFLANKLTVENVMCVIELAIIYDQVELRKLCESKIRLNSREILQSPSFLECDEQVVNHILRMNFLSCSETEVFEACMAWVKAVSKEDKLTRDIVQTHLGDSFFHICFGSMPMDDFVKILPLYGNIFSACEYNEILQTISKLQIQPKIFKESRQAMHFDESKMVKCNRFASTLGGKKYYAQDLVITTFTTNTALLFGQFTVFSLYNRNDDLTKELHLFVTILSGSSHSEAQFSIHATHNNGAYHVKLPKPIIVKPNQKYSLRLSIPDNQYFFVRALNSSVTLESNIILQFFDDRLFQGTITGLIGEMGFNLLE